MRRSFLSTHRRRRAKGLPGGGAPVQRAGRVDSIGGYGAPVQCAGHADSVGACVACRPQCGFCWQKRRTPRRHACLWCPAGVAVVETSRLCAVLSHGGCAPRPFCRFFSPSGPGESLVYNHITIPRDSRATLSASSTTSASKVSAH